METEALINDVNVAELQAFREMVTQDASKADRNPVLVAK